MYNILFLGTPFMDGHYADKERAEEVRDYFQETFPNIRFALVKNTHGFWMSDDIFWNRNYEKIQAYNDSRTIVDRLKYEVGGSR